jgi:mono/diheme cytochrome c family protein
MKKRLLGVGIVMVATLSLVFVVYGQTAASRPAATAAPAAASTAVRPAAQAAPTAPTAKSVAAQQEILDYYCIECHNTKVRSGGLAIAELKLARVGDHRKEWEKIVKKLRAGMMPPIAQERPDPVTYKALITWIENELDRNAVPFMPPPGLHRMNRTEYANAIKDLLDLEIDPAQYLPSDDSTRGFDNIASALTVSSTLVEAYVSAAGKISRLAIGEPASQTLKVYRVPEDTTQDYHVEGMPFGTRGGLLTTHIFPSDGEYTIRINTVIGDNMSQNAFGTIPCEKLEVLLDGERLDLLNWGGGGGGGGGGRGGGAAATCANTPNATARGNAALAAAAVPAAPATAAGATPAPAVTGADAVPANLVNTVCASCHTLDRVKSKVGDAAAWTATIARMKEKPNSAAAALTDQQVPLIVDYLARSASTLTVAPAAPAGGGGGGGGGGRGGGGGGMVVRFKTTAGPHRIGATFLATNFAPLLDMNVHPARSTVQTGPTPGYTFFPHVGSIHIEGPFNAKAATDSASRRKIFTCKPTSAATETTCARSILTRLAGQAFRRQATAADVQVLMTFFAEGRKDSDFDHGIANALAHMLADINFLARVEVEPTTIKPGQTYAITDTELASRLSYFLWSAGPDLELRNLATQARLKDPVVLDAQVRRMLKDPRAEALAVNFAGQWLNLRAMSAVGPLPMLYPNFDDPLRQAMRREVELLFDTIVREDRSLIELLTADYTFVDERLARHYGIKGIYGSQFRRVPLGPELDVRKGLLGKGAFLTTTSKPERNSPVTRGMIIMEKLLGVPPPNPPADVPPLMPKNADSRGNGKAPSMRQNMLDHRVRQDCIQCHALMDPIGFTLENFDAIALWRTDDAGEPIKASETLYDGTKVEGPAGLRKWLVGYSDQFVSVAAEKLLTYALGRGLEPEDMPLVRKITRDAARNNNKFSALVMGVVKSEPFRKNMKIQETGLKNTSSTKEGN